MLLLLPVCAAKILSKYLATALLPYYPQSSVIKIYYSTAIDVNFPTIFPHLPISTFSLQIQSCWYRIRKEKIKSIFNPP